MVNEALEGFIISEFRSRKECSKKMVGKKAEDNLEKISRKQQVFNKPEKSLKIL